MSIREFIAATGHDSFLLRHADPAIPPSLVYGWSDAHPDRLVVDAGMVDPDVYTRISRMFGYCWIETETAGRPVRTPLTD